VYSKLFPVHSGKSGSSDLAQGNDGTAGNSKLRGVSAPVCRPAAGRHNPEAGASVYLEKFGCPENTWYGTGIIILTSCFVIGIIITYQKAYDKKSRTGI